jgi:hypothetical protein
MGKNGLQRQNRLDEIEHRYDLLLESARDAIAYIHEGLRYANGPWGLWCRTFEVAVSLD